MTLLAHYKLDSSANDFGPNSYHLTENGSPSYTTGAINNGISLTENKYLSRSLTTEYDGLTDFTFMFRAKFATLPAVGNYDHFFDLKQVGHSQGDETIRGYLHNNSGSYILYFYVENNAGANLALSYNLTSNSKTWHTDGNFHEFKWKFDYTYPGTSTLTLFVDNAEITSTTTTSDIKPKPNPTLFELGRSSAQTFDGVLDEVRFYNHVLTSAQDYLLYSHDGSVEFTIKDIDYTFGHTSTFGANFYAYDVYENTIYSASELYLTVTDEDRTIVENAGRYTEIRLTVDGTTRFLGLAVDFNTTDTDTNSVIIYSRDYWDVWLRSPVTSSYTNQPRSTVLADIAQNNQFLEPFGFTVTGIETTTSLITNKFAGDVAGVIAANFALNEGFTVFIDETKNVIFRQQNFVDSGVHLNDNNGDIRESDFQRSGEGVVNVVSVRGATGAPGATDRAAISIIYEDDDLIQAMGGTKVTMPEIIDTSISTTLDAVNRAIYEIERRNSIPTQAEITAELNHDLTRGKLVTITDPGENITAEKFYILSARHDYLSQSTKLKLFFYTRTTIDQINDIQRSAAKAGQPMRDSSATTTKFKVTQEDVTLKAFVDVDTRNFTNSVYGEFNYGEYGYGQIAGSFSSSISNEQMTLTNKGMEVFLRIIGQVATVPNDYDGGKAHIALGTGTTAIAFTNTTLETEAIRKGMIAGFPQRTTDLEGKFRILIDDTDVVTATYTNIALFNASSSGDIAFSHKFASAVNKTEDNTLRITIRFTLSGTALTTAGGNLLADLFMGQGYDYPDNSNAAMELTTAASDTFRKAMDTGFPSFASGNTEQLTWLSNVSTSEISGNSLSNETLTNMDLYNKTSSGIKIISPTIATSKILATENLGLQFRLRLVRE